MFLQSKVEMQPHPQFYCCKRCKKELYVRKRRSLLVKTLLPNLPVRKYFCISCQKNQYVRVSSEANIRLLKGAA